MRVNELELDELKAGLADGSILVVDVREPHEFAAGHIPGFPMRATGRWCSPVRLAYARCGHLNSRRPAASISTAIILAASRSG
jgi:rhodanese-related sulfurtransferase